jgi:hypothetical protein
MKSWAAIIVLASCGWAADDDLRLPPPLPGSPNYKGGPTVEAHALAPEAVDQDCRAPAYGASIFTRESDLDAAKGASIETPQLTLSYSASAATVGPGRRITLILEFEPKPRMHVYAPGAGQYTSIDWQIVESKLWKTHPAKFPASHMLALSAINETVPVFDGRVRLVRDITISRDAEAAQAFGPNYCLTIEGSFRYQACDDKVCYFPKTLPLTWIFRNSEREKQRAPARR